MKPPELGPIDFDPHAPQPLDLVMDELMALDARTLLPVNLDVTSAAVVVLGAVPEIQKQRMALVALVGEVMVEPIDRLELIARAALQAHARHRAIESGADIAPLVALVTDRRDLLRAEVRSLIARKLLPPGVAEELAQAHGHKNVSFDVLQLAAALRETWDAVKDKTGLTIDEVVEAEAAANQLMTAVGLRGQGARAPSADVRQRAFTLLVERYDDARRLIAFLRWKHRDADRIAPSCFQSRGRRRGKSTAHAEAAQQSETAVHTETVHASVLGLPGGSPFVTGEAAG